MDEPDSESKKVSWFDIADGIVNLPLTLVFLLWLGLTKLFKGRSKVVKVINIVFGALFCIYLALELIDTF